MGCGATGLTSVPQSTRTSLTRWWKKYGDSRRRQIRPTYMRNRQRDIESVPEPYERVDDSDGTEEPVPSDKAFDLTSLLVGFGIGVGLAILFAPQSGDETRQWISASAEDGFRQLRRRGRRLVFEAQDLLDRGEYGVNRALRTGKNMLESVASKLE